MTIRNFKMFVLAGAVAVLPSMASAFSGKLVECLPAINTPTDVLVSPGLGCDTVLNKFAIDAMVDGCTANAAAPWDTWAANKVGGKMPASEVANVAKAQLKVKGTVYGSCNFAGSTDSATGALAGKLALFRSDGATKIAGGKGAFFANVGGDLATQSARLQGLMTKGFGAGAQISVLIGIDLANPNNSNVLACNLGAVCPPPITPSTILSLVTTASSSVVIGYPQDSDCTAGGAPYPCCTGAGTGNC